MARPGAGHPAQRITSAGCRVGDGRGLQFAPTNTVPAEQLPDHRLAYLDYEGPVSGDRGAVTRLDSGEYVSQEESPNLWALKLTGHFIRGQLTLRRIAPDFPSWQLRFEAASPEISAD